MKFIYVLSALALTLTFGCNNQPEQAKAVEKETVEKETVRVVEVETPAKVTVEKEEVKEEEKGTSIEINRKGGSVKTKDVDIKINE